MGYDVIGDIHGNAAKLEALLRKLGYVEKATGWVPPVGKQAIFLEIGRASCRERVLLIV